MSSVILRGAVGVITIREENGFITALGWGPDEDRESGEAPSHLQPHPLLERAACRLFRGGRRYNKAAPATPGRPPGTLVRGGAGGRPWLR
jgi:hypothetical protein